MSYKKDFDIFVGGKSGIFKGIKIDKKACISKNIQSLMSIRPEHEVTAMSWADENEDKILIACGAKGDRSVKIYDSQSAAFTSSFSCESGHGNIKGLSEFDDGIVTAVASGHVNLWRFNGDNELLIEAGESLEKMKHSLANKNIIATGGKEHKLQLFDLEKKAKIFVEKNVPHDWLQLRVPLWISDIGFLPNSSHIVTCSKHGHIRLYDPTAQRRPVINLEMKNEALTTLAVASREKYVVVGSGKGVMNLVDLRKPGKILNTYKDFVGGITSVACPKSNPYIVSVGLDRYLRIHHLDTKVLLKKIYLTSRLSSMVLRSEFSMEGFEDVKNETTEPIAKRSRGETKDDDVHLTDVDSENDAEYDNLFENMAVIENEENEADMMVNKTKSCQIKTAKRKNLQTTKKTAQDNRKRLKKRNHVEKTV